MSALFCDLQPWTLRLFSSSRGLLSPHLQALRMTLKIESENQPCLHFQSNQGSLGFPVFVTANEARLLWYSSVLRTVDVDCLEHMPSLF